MLISTARTKTRKTHPWYSGTDILGSSLIGMLRFQESVHETSSYDDTTLIQSFD